MTIQRHHVVWGKTDRHGHSRRAGGPGWNPLPAHVLDTAAAAGELWDRYLTPGTQTRLAQAFGGGNKQTARQVIMFLAGMHDMGKGSACFLRKIGTRRDDEQLRGPIKHAWLRLADEHVLPVDTAGLPSARHEHITAAHLARVLGCTCTECGGTGPRSKGLHAVAALLGGHHGHIPQQDTIDRAAGAAPIAEWEPLYRAQAQEAAELIGINLNALPDLVNPVRPSVLPLFLGLVVLADWIASNEILFTYRHLADGPDAWWSSARQQAQDAVTRLNLDRWAAKPATWAELHPGTAPRPFQAAALAALPPAGQTLVIIESDTGSGKTKLAFAIAHHLAAVCGYQGLYMAMPTRAATSQAAGVLREFVKTAAPGVDSTLALVHGTADAADITHQLLDAAATPQQNTLDDLLAYLSDQPDDMPTDPEGRAVLNPWYLRRCLGLVATFAVGTIDQVVLAAQPSRHWAVRMLALAGKTLIIDEAHAYEMFQQGMLGALVEWLTDAGASVVVLSATLPTTTRRALTDAWCRGLRTTPTDYGHIGAITIVDHTGTITRTGPTAPPPELKTHLDFMTDPGPKALADRLLEEAADGGITVVIRNRVAPAVELHDTLLARAKAHGWKPEEITLLHGRFLGRDRLPVETRLLADLGPATDDNGAPLPNPNRPNRMLVVATQVVEQSLDIDFDRMYTDLAPVDLIIQRRGRLHRHTTNNPSRKTWCAEPRLTVLWRKGPKGLPLVEPPDPHNGRPIGSYDGAVYAPYILAASWHALQTLGPAASTWPGQTAFDMSTPRDSTALIEAVYTTTRPDPAGHLGRLLAPLWDQWQHTLAEEEQEVALRAFRPFTSRSGRPTTVRSLASGGAHGDGDDDAKTGIRGIQALSRLGDPSIQVLLLWQQPNGAITYDLQGTLPADLRHRPADNPRARQQKKDHILNTISIKQNWFHGPRALPQPETWPRIPGTALKNQNVALINPATGCCISGPLGLTYTPTVGLGRC